MPQGEVVRQGHVDVTRDEREVHIVQVSERAIIDWRSFDIGAQASVHVLQPTTEMVLLNRVTGRTTSELAGGLYAGGHVYLINPNGIRIAPGGSVDAASFVASTLDIGDRDFENGVLRFGSAERGAMGTIVHDGRIGIDPGGFVALLGFRIEQRGEIHAPLSQVGLGAGTSAALAPGRDDFLTMAQAAGMRPVDVEADGTAGSVAPPAIVMAGDIEARGGQVQLNAPIATRTQHATDAAMAISGTIRAPRHGRRSGTIRLDGIGGVVRLSGLLEASNNGSDVAMLPGGTVSVHGSRVVVERMGINVSGAAGGGRVVLSTGARERPTGGSPAAEAAGEPSILIDGPALINANATQRGHGGDIGVLADGPVVILGRMQASSVVRSMVTDASAPDGASLPYCQRISFHAGRALSPLELPRAHPLAMPVARPAARLFARQGMPAGASVPAASLPDSTPNSTPNSPLPYSFASRLASPLRIPEAGPHAAAAAAFPEERVPRLVWSPDSSQGPSPDPSSGPSPEPGPGMAPWR
ncbi:filamentous hemagglutinin N-terminal domain-containing protein [Robbsia sp. Bb-Pol-6]|uniref:Filamentous hemagglutinin N-terminal domain-containing protein n=2 Tax=Robbsia betulipollinis TaxID=2981849 RepID=A0ABT3ZHI3_9BURK|nr:filamentous hemagglutinin N-terminal domain-containing protein [Robbsia betulipollinis]